jgi:hypothetical protein
VLAIAARAGHGNRMPRQSETLSREERLAAKLRENLRRRKTQAREKQGGGESPDLSKEDGNG